MIEDKVNSRIVRLFFISIIILILIGAFSGILCTHYPIRTDDLSLMNPPYMLRNYSHMVYPIYGYYNNMPVHPPGYYYIIGWLYSLGISIRYSFLLPILLAYILVLIFTICSKMDYRYRLAIILGLLPIERVFDASTIRPDFFLTAVWISGLICLESARQLKWNSTRLGIGSSLLAFSSCLHFFSSFAFLGIVPYAISYFYQNKNSISIKKLAALILPAAVIILIYLYIFIYPNYDTIIDNIQANKSDGNVLTAYKIHLRKIWGIIPYSLAAFTIIAVFKKTRLLAWASLPMTLFVLFYSTFKSPGYYFPEIILLRTGMFYVIVSSIIFLLPQRVLSSKALSIVLIIPFLLIQVFIIAKNTLIEALNDDSETVTARACNFNILGDDAKVAGRLDLWFVSGASKYYNLNNDSQFTDSIAFNICNLQFIDVFIEHGHMANYFAGKQQLSISDYYLNNSLYLHSFYATNNMYERTTINLKDNFLPMLTFSVSPPSTITGYACYNNKDLFYCEEDSSGMHWFFAVKTDDTLLTNNIIENSLWVNCIPIEPKFPLPFSTYNTINTYLTWGIMDDRSKMQLIDAAAESSIIRDLIKISILKVDKNKLIRELNGNDHAIQFFKSLEDFAGDKGYYNPL